MTELRDKQYEGVLNILRTLPANQQEVIRLKFQGDLSYKKISEITNLSTGNVGFFIHTGLKAIREKAQFGGARKGGEMNNDINNPNDPKWTAYALDEITDGREKAEMDAALRESPEIAALVKEIRETAGWLKAELGAEPAERLTLDQRANIEKRAGETASGGFLAKLFAQGGWFGMNPAWISIGAAAVLVVAFVAFQQFHQQEVSPTTQPVTAGNTATPDRTGTSEPEQPAMVAQAMSPFFVGSAPVPVRSVAVDPNAFVAPTEIPKEIPPPTMDEPVFDATGLATGATVGIGTGTSNLLPSVSTVATAAAPPPPPKPRAKPVPVGGNLSMPMMREVERESRDSVRAPQKHNTEDYDAIRDNPFLNVAQNPLSTFSIDVDTASYSNVRRFLNLGSLPPKDSVRIEELVNYFDYDYKSPKDGKPFAVNAEMTEAPWNPKHKLLRIALKGREIAEGKRPESNLVFLIDVSGSMMDANKLPLVKTSMKMLVDRLTESDRVAIVVYAGNTRLLLPSTSGDQKERIRAAIDSLRAGGSTAGASGIQLAYKAAEENFIKGGVNRIILATDGDFNVGVTSRGALTSMIEEKAKNNIFLTTLGFGMGNYKDPTLELLADKGHGNYAYIDTENEARKVLVEQMNSTLVAIAKDVKIQVEFNPKRVTSYRLLGYENRLMAKEDFNDDTKQAGVIGAGHAVTAFYELTTDEADADSGVDPLKYQKKAQTTSSAASREIATVKIRSKEPEKDRSVLTEFVVKDNDARFSAASGDFKFAAAVASFGMTLRDSAHKGNADYEQILKWANEGKGADRYGYRAEFIRLLHRAVSLPPR